MDWLTVIPAYLPCVGALGLAGWTWRECRMIQRQVEEARADLPDPTELRSLLDELKRDERLRRAANQELASAAEMRDAMGKLGSYVERLETDWSSRAARPEDTTNKENP